MKTTISLKTILFICTLFTASLSSTVYGQTINNKWKHELTTAMDQFIQCQSSGGEKSMCSNFLGESLKKVYNLDDFYSTSMKRYLRPAEISNLLKESNRWTLLGRSFEQNALSAAQESANANKAVVAVYVDPAGLGHIVLILPGELTTSGSWGLRVPNAASFLLTEPQKSFVDKGLSFAFTKNMMKDVFLYVREY